MTETLAQRFLDHALAEELFPAPGLALIAVSGGADSTALLDLMLGNAEALALGIAVAHIHHGTGAPADAAQAMVRRTAEGHGVPFHCARVELPQDWSETKARDLRYRELEDLRRAVGADYLVLGHNRDDQAETVLLRFLNGSGTFGLAGMDPLGRGLVRPLLSFSRAEIEDWLESTGLSDRVVHDPSNEDTRHDRNWVRHELLPLVRSRFPTGPANGFLRTASHAAGEREAWARLLRVPDLEFRSGDDWVEVARAPLQMYDEMLCEALLRGVARELGVVLGRRQSTLVRRFVTDGTSGHSLDVGGGWRFELEFDCVRLARSIQPGPPADTMTVDLNEASDPVSWGGWRFEAVPDDAGTPRRDSLSTWVYPGQLTIRGLLEGDRIKPLGGRGGRPVRRLLMEARIPVPVRWRYPIIESGGGILWVPGVCRSSMEVPEAGARVIRVDAIET